MKRASKTNWAIITMPVKYSIQRHPDPLAMKAPLMIGPKVGAAAMVMP
jgi:hypothetical protein